MQRRTGCQCAFQAQASHDTLLSHPNVTRHFDLIQHTPSVESAVSKLPSGTFSPSVISIDLDNVPTVERKYESAKKDKKEKAAAAAAAAGGEVASEKADAKGKGRGKKEAAAAAGEGGDEKAPSVNVNQEVGQGKAGDVAGNKKEKKEKAKKEAGDAAASGTPDTARRPKKEKGGEAGGGGSGGAAAPADDVLSPGLIDLRVGLIVDGELWPNIERLSSFTWPHRTDDRNPSNQSKSTLMQTPFTWSRSTSAKPSHGPSSLVSSTTL